MSKHTFKPGAWVDSIRSRLIKHSASLCTKGLSDYAEDWNFPKTMPMRWAARMLTEVKNHNEWLRSIASELKKIYDELGFISRQQHTAESQGGESEGQGSAEDVLKKYKRYYCEPSMAGGFYCYKADDVLTAMHDFAAQQTAALRAENERLRGEVEQNAIDFGTWYSGMDREKVERAYKRYLTENHITHAKQP